MAERDLEDWEDPEPDDEDQDGDDTDDEDTHECPHCGAGVYEDCERCPECGDYITPRARSTPPSSGRWFVAAVVVMIAIMVLAVFWSI